MTEPVLPQRISAPFEHEACFSGDRIVSVPQDDQYLKWNYELCRAVNLNGLHVVLQNMVDCNALHPRQAELFLKQAGVLLALMRSENSRAWEAAPIHSPKKGTSP